MKRSPIHHLRLDHVVQYEFISSLLYLPMEKIRKNINWSNAGTIFKDYIFPILFRTGSRVFYDLTRWKRYFANWTYTSEKKCYYRGNTGVADQFNFENITMTCVQRTKLLLLQLAKIEIVNSYR